MSDVMIKTAPAVFAVEDVYQIIVPVTQRCIMWIETGGENYYDASNGIMRSQRLIHRIDVPKQQLDASKRYALCYRREIKRKPYYPQYEGTERLEFEFCPVPKGKVRAYQIADAHGMVEEPIKAVKEFEKIKGKIDFLILNGDIPDHIGEIENFDTIYEIASRITNGKLPIVFSRGNHDMRGKYAESIAEYIPSFNGNTYYTFCFGEIWGIVLDCGEDKADSNAEYGGTICCHSFRIAETEFIKSVIERAEYKNAEYRLVVVHNPFTEILKPPFDIEKKVYAEWAKLIKENIKPNLMLSGHFHRLGVNMPGDCTDNLGHPCPVVIGSKPQNWTDEKNKYYAGCGLEFSDGCITVLFTDDKGKLDEFKL